MSRAVTEGILRGFRDGPLTSTSLLANAPDAGRALARWKELLGATARRRIAFRRRCGAASTTTTAALRPGHSPEPDRGPPLDGRALSGRVARRQGPFSRHFFASSGGSAATAAAAAPRWPRNSPARCSSSLDHGLQATHLNGHQYVELLPTIRGLVGELLEKFHIRVVRVAAEPSLWPLVFRRGLRPSAAVFAAAQQFFARQFRRRMMRLDAAHADAFFGTALAGRIGMGRMREFLASGLGATAGLSSSAPGATTTPRVVPGLSSSAVNTVGQANRGTLQSRPVGGLMEICLHPAEADAAAAVAGWHDPSAALRPQELQMLVSEELAEYLIARSARLGRLSRLADP